jgi:hypothetical protein
VKQRRRTVKASQTAARKAWRRRKLEKYNALKDSKIKSIKEILDNLGKS